MGGGVRLRFFAAWACARVFVARSELLLSLLALQQGVLDDRLSVDCDALGAALAMLVSGVGEAVDGGVGKAFLAFALETGECFCFLRSGVAGMGFLLAVALFFCLVRLGTIMLLLDYAV